MSKRKRSTKSSEDEEMQTRSKARKLAQEEEKKEDEGGDEVEEEEVEEKPKAKGRGSKAKTTAAKKGKGKGKGKGAKAKEEDDDDGEEVAAEEEAVGDPNDPDLLSSKVMSELYEADWDATAFKAKLGFDHETKQSRDEFQGVFAEIAEYLMGGFLLFANGRAFKFAEIEFYCCNKTHEDVYTHCDENQQTNAQWYFHRSGKSYKAGTYKGLDITFGAENKGYGGILIRALKDLKTGEYVEGSCTCVDKLLGLNAIKGKTPDIATLVSQSTFNLDVTKKGLLCVKPGPSANQSSKPTLYSSSRVGLTLKKTDGDRHYFLMKPYRFMLYPTNVDKGKILLFLGMYKSGKDIDEIVKITGCRKATVKKYFDTYDDAKKSSPAPTEFHSKNLNNDDLCKLYAIL